MHDVIRHPSLEQLAAFDAGRLHAAEWEEIERHVTQCTSCCGLLDGLPADSFAALLKAGSGKSTSLPQSETIRRESHVSNVPPGKEARDRLPSPYPLPPARPARAAALEVPRELAAHSRYRILEPLGAGGMGTVFKSEHRLMERIVALKIIRRDLMDWPAAVERFRQEVRAAARLVHPHIVTAYDAEQAGDVHFLVMEFVQGESLDRVIAREGPASIAQACDWARQAALGLQHAWEQGMVHRDIKPANLLLTPAGQIKILDFGLARFANEAASAAGLTPEGSMLGTPDYIAPEQAVAARSADTRADIYSLGCTLYHLLAGVPPFPDGAPLHKLLFHQNRQPRRLTELRSEVPAELDQVVQRMLAKDPAERYQTPAEVAGALAPFVAEAWQTAPLGQMGRVEPVGRSRSSKVVSRLRIPRSALLRKIARPLRRVATAALLVLAGALLSPIVWHVLKQDSSEARNDGPPIKHDGTEPRKDGPPAEQNNLSIVVPTHSVKPAAAQEMAPVGEIRCLGGVSGPFSYVAFSHDCRLALGAGPKPDFILHLWDLQKGKEIMQLKGHTAPVLGLAISPDGKRALSGSQDMPGKVCLWDLEKGCLLKTLLGHRSWVRGVTFMPDERYVVSGSNDASVRLWHTENGGYREYEGHSGVVGCVAVSRFGRFVASSGWDNSIRVWDLVMARQKHIYRGHEAPVPTVIFSNGGDYLLSGSHDRTLRLWDVEHETQLRCFRGHSDAVNGVALTANHRWALSGSSDRTVRLWDVANEKEVYCLKGHTAAVLGVAFCPGENQAVSGAEDGTFRIWQLPREEDRDGKTVTRKP